MPPTTPKALATAAAAAAANTGSIRPPSPGSIPALEIRWQPPDASAAVHNYPHTSLNEDLSQTPKTGAVFIKFPPK
jgi:hypothetical protein